MENDEHFDPIAVRESVLARCRRDGGPLEVVKATGVNGAVFVSDTLPPHDAKFLALELELNGAAGAFKVNGEELASVEILPFVPAD